MLSPPTLRQSINTSRGILTPGHRGGKELDTCERRDACNTCEKRDVCDTSERRETRNMCQRRLTCKTWKISDTYRTWGVQDILHCQFSIVATLLSPLWLAAEDASVKTCAERWRNDTWSHIASPAEPQNQVAPNQRLSVDQKKSGHIQSHVCIVLTFIRKLISLVVLWGSIQDLH